MFAESGSKKMWSKFANVTPALGNLRGGKFGQFGGPFIKEESFTFHHIRSFNVMQKNPENYD